MKKKLWKKNGYYKIFKFYDRFIPKTKNDMKK